MQSTASNVDDFMTTLPPERLDALTRLRELCLENLPGYVESMEYGMPCYSRNGVVEVAFNSQKNYISVYVLNKDVLDRHRDVLKNVGKSCIRFRRPEQVDFPTLEKLVRETRASTAPICP